MSAVLPSLGQDGFDLRFVIDSYGNSVASDDHLRRIYTRQNETFAGKPPQRNLKNLILSLRYEQFVQRSARREFALAKYRNFVTQRLYIRQNMR